MLSEDVVVNIQNVNIERVRVAHFWVFMLIIDLIGMFILNT